MNLKATFTELMKEDAPAPRPGNPLLERLVCAKDFSIQLVQIGIIPVSAFWWRSTDGIFEVTALSRPEGHEEDSDVPAWTKEELDIMLGPKVRLPKLVEVGFFSRVDPTFTSWGGDSTRIDMAKGADCSARVLLYGIQQKGIDVKEANKRFLDVFKPVELGVIKDLSVYQRFL